MPLSDEPAEYLRDPGPDLMAELDAAEDIAMGRAASAETEWGVRYASASGEHIHRYSSGDEGEATARLAAADYARLGGKLVRRTVTYGPWTEVPPEAEEKP